MIRTNREAGLSINAKVVSFEVRRTYKSSTLLKNEVGSLFFLADWGSWVLRRPSPYPTAR